MRNIYAFRKGFRVQLSYKNVTYHGPLRPTQVAACADLSIVQACASREEQVKYLGKLVHLEKNRRRGAVRTAAGEEQEARVMGQEAASEHLGQEPEEVGAPADEDAGGEEAVAPAAGHAEEEPEARGAEEKRVRG